MIQDDIDYVRAYVKPGDYIPHTVVEAFERIVERVFKLHEEITRIRERRL